MELRFFIARDFYDSPMGRKYGDADFIISDMNWNDFGFYTSHRLYATPDIIPHESSVIRNVYIGDFCIMNIVDPKEGHEPNSLYKKMKPSYKFVGEIPFNFVSMPTDLDSAKMLSLGLTLEQRDNLIQSLHLIQGEDKFYHRALSTDIGQQIFEKSFLRGTTWQDFSQNVLKEYKQIMKGDRPIDESFEELFRSRIPG